MDDERMFQEVVEALKRGDKGRARELLTHLLKEEQGSATYWIWMSASVETPKEQIYCLQTALKLEPENLTALRGLVLLGALPPDENIQPFPLNRPRAWEQKLLLAHELPKQKGKSAFYNPTTRLGVVVVVGLAVIAAAVYGLMNPLRRNAALPDTNTPGPSPTFTFTPTFMNATGQASPTYIGPTPLWMQLPLTYTPTPLYVRTPRGPLSYEQNRVAESAYKAGDWETYIENMKMIVRAEPDSADVLYYIGEGYRFQGNAREALDYCNRALKVDPNFGPAYLCLARGRLIQDPNASIEGLFDLALERDPNFGEVYLERARYYLHYNKTEKALADLQTADGLLPNSVEVYKTYAEVYSAMDDTQQALAAAQKANSLDLTNLPVYKLLGGLYIENGQYPEAAKALDTYVQYETEDGRAYAQLGQAYYEMGDYESAVINLNRAFELDSAGLRRFRLYRGLAHLELGNYEFGLSDIEEAYGVDQDSFEANLGLVRAYYYLEKFGNAFLKVETARSLALTDEQVALVHYWRALIQEKRGEMQDANEEWQALLEMPTDAMTFDMRAEAETHLRSSLTATGTSKAPTKTATPKAGAVNPSRTPSP
jgi:tetratricopeptide (TPR) repeat protein